MPDDDDFNPDSMLPELTKPTPDLDDSLCFDEGEETQLPFDELDIGVPSVSEVHEDNSTTHTEPEKGEDLNDSLCGDNADEETQYHMDTANDIQPAAQSTPTPNLDDSMEMVGEDDTLQATTHSPEVSKLPPSQTKVLSGYEGASCDDPNLDELFPETIHDPQDCSQEGSKTGGTEGDSGKTNKTEEGSNKLEGCSDKLEKSSSPIQQSSKVVPSFGKKKKGFMPPTVKAPDPAISSSSATATKPAPKTKKSSSTNKTKGQDCEGAKLDEKSSVGKTQQNQKKEHCSGANKENSPSQDDTQKPNFSAPKLADTSVTTTDYKVSGTAEVSANVTKAEKTKATVKKPPQGKKDNDAKKQEKEKKKLEKEQKKLEQERKKAEKERLKEEKRLEQERKKAEREQKKIEKDQKKLEREQKKAQKQQKPQKKKSPGKDSGAQASSNSEAQHSGSCEQDTVEKTSETNLMAASDKTEDKASAVSNCGGTNASESADNSNKLLDTDSTSPSETTSAASTDAADTTPPSECKPNAPEDTATETSSSEKVQDNSDREMLETMKPRETNLSSPVETSAEDSGDSVVTKQTDVSATTNSFNQTNSDVVSNERLSEKSNMLQVTSGSDKENKNAPPKKATPLKDPQKQPISKAKKNQVNKSARKQKSTNSQTQNKKKTKSAITPNDKKVSSSAGSRKRKTVETQSTSESEIEPPEPKKPRSKPSNYYGPVWVQCEKPDCQKWRQLKDCLDPSEIPDKWTCSMNTGAYTIVTYYPRIHMNSNQCFYVLILNDISCFFSPVQSQPIAHAWHQRSSGQSLRTARNLWSHRLFRGLSCGPRWMDTLGWL